MKLDNYKTITGFEQWGDSGSLGLRIQAAGHPLPDLERTSITYPAQDFLNKLKEEITAAIKSTCPYALQEAHNERHSLLSCFPEPIFVEEIPNGYCGQGCCRHLPWFIITTKVGRFKIGWRKRVISIDWSETRGTLLCEDLFDGENVTKGERDIHAWDLEKAKEYINRILITATK